MPGDITVGDSVGVAVARADFAENVIHRLSALRSGLAEHVAQVRRGQFSDAWVDTYLVLRER